MLTDTLRIRLARNNDCQRIRTIYSYYVLHTPVSFEYEVPAVAEMETRMQSVQQKYPYLVAELEDEIVGYASAPTAISVSSTRHGIPPNVSS